VLRDARQVAIVEGEAWLRTSPQTRDREKLDTMKFLKWASTSLLGHIVVFEGIFSLPMFLLLSALNYSLDIFTVGWARYAAIVWASLGAVGAILVGRNN
jgi:hypothetical protein